MEDRCLLSGFQVPPTYGSPAYLANMRVADVNNDGHPDLLGVDDYTDGLDVFLNAGDGTFEAPRGFKIADGIGTLAVADFTGDGNPDVVLGNFYTGDLYLVKGDGRGGFTNAAEGLYSDLNGLPEVPSFAKVDRNISGLYTADFNGDGRPDFGLVMTTSYPNINDLDLPEVKIYLNQGDGTFAPSTQFRTIFMQRGVVPGDYNGDGKTDLLVLGQTTDYKKGVIAFYAGRGDGTFAPAVLTDADANTMPFATADFNGDGVPDIAYGTWLGSGFSTYGKIDVQLGNGDGTFGPVIDTFDGVGINSVAVGDFNGDGHPDIVASDYQGCLAVVYGNGDGTFRPGVGYDAGAETYKVYTGDFDGDGRTDVAVPDRFLPCGVHVFTSRPDGTFRGVRVYFAGQDTLASAGGDFNGDGRMDVMLTNDRVSGNTIVMLGNADGTFTQSASYTSSAWTDAIALGDLNGDGKLDAVVAGTTGESVSVLIGNGDGTFQGPTNYGAGHYPYGVALADLNGDGKTDLAVSSYDGNVRLYAGNGDGTLAAPVVIATVGNPQDIAAVDFDRDGRMDLIISDHWTSGLSLLHNNGDGTFSIQALPANGQVSHIYTPDLNGDGVPDLVATLPAQGQVAVWLGLAGGMYGNPRYFATLGGNPETVGFGDFNGDGHVDIVALNAGIPHQLAATISLLLADGAGGYRLVSGGRLHVGAHPEGATVGDFNGDGGVDIAIGTVAGLAVVQNTGEMTQMEVVPVDQTVKEGVAFSGTVATLEPFSGNVPASQFEATIAWGDGTTSAATVTQPGGPNTPYVITAGHTYRTGGTHTTVVYVHDTAGKASVSSQGKVTVTPAAITMLNDGVHPWWVTAVAGVPTTAVVARFTSDNPQAVAADFTATVNWGDFSASSGGTVVADPAGGFDVVATHTYTATIDSFLDPSWQRDPIVVSVSSKGGASAQGYDYVNLVPPADPDGPMQAQGVPVTAQAGVPTGPITVAAYTHTAADAAPGDVWAYLTWAGATPGALDSANGTVTQPGGPGSPFVVNASLTFARTGDVTVYVSLIDWTHGVGTSTTTVAHVTAAERTTTTTTLAAPDPATAAVGHPLTFVATVGGAGSLTPPAGGTVKFRDGDAVVGTAPLDDRGQARWTTTALAFGAHTLSAAYAGDATFAPSPVSNSVTVWVTPLAPVATTGAATDVTTTTVSLAGTVNPSGGNTSARFVWGDTPDLTASGPNLTTLQMVGAGTGDVALGAALTGLTPGHTYYFRTLATNAGGVSLGKVLSFTTAPAPQRLPDVGTLSATRVGPTGALFRGWVNPNGADTEVAFVYGKDPALPAGTSFRTSAQAVGHDTARMPFTTAVPNLTPGRWYIRATATSAAGTVAGDVVELIVPEPARVATETSCTASPDPAVLGAPVTLTVTVSPARPPAGVTTAALAGPGGTVTFTIDGRDRTPVRVRVVDGLGVAELIVTDLGIGTHRIVAAYRGDGQYAGSQVVRMLTVVAPPVQGGPRVLAVQRFGYHTRPTALVLTFSDPLDPARARDLTNYRLTVEGGRRPLRIASATLGPDGRTVTLRPARLLPLRYRYELTVVGAAPGGLADARGRYLDGAGDGRPGTNGTMTITRHDLADGPSRRAAAAVPTIGVPARAVPRGPAGAWHAARARM